MPELTLEQKVEVMVKDAAKGLATNSEVVTAITEAVAKDMEKKQAEKDKLFTEANNSIKQLEKFTEQLEKQVKAMTRSNFVTLKASDGSYNGMWGSLDACKTAGLFVLASIFNNEKAKKQLDDRGIELEKFTEDREKAMGSDVDTTGGILVPSELIPSIILLIERYGIYRQDALEYPMGSGESLAPKLASGLTVYCPGAGVAPTDSDLAFQGVGMNAKKWMTLTYLDSELDEDSAIAIGELIGFMIGWAFAKKEDEVGFLGDGTSTYFGHVGIAGALRAVDATIGNIKSLVVAAGNAYSEITLANFETLLGTVPDYADDGNLKHYCSRLFYYSVMVKLAMAAGGANATEILAGSVSRQKTFLGYPVRFTPAMPKAEANSQVCNVFGNLKLGAYIGDRRKMTIDRSTEFKFSTDQVAIRGTERVAPTVHGVGDTTDAGPICGLITAAS